MSKLKYLKEDFFIYGLGTIFSKGISFLSIPIFTRIFLPYEFGELEILLIIGAVYYSILNIGLDSSLSFFYISNDSFSSKDDVLKNIFQITVTWGLISSSFFILVCLFFYKNFELNSIILVITIFFLEFLSSNFLNVFRLEGESRKYIIYQTFQQSSGVILSLIFIFFIEKNIIYILYGRLISILITALILAYKKLNFKELVYYDLNKIKIILMFGLPLIPNSLISVIFNYTDRVFISNLLGETDLGIYSVGSKFANLNLLVTSAFSLTILPLILKSLKENDLDFINYIRDNYFKYSEMIVIFIASTSSLIIPMIFGADFKDSYLIISSYSLYLYYYSAYIMVSLGIWKFKKTKMTLYTTIMSFLLNFIFSYFLILFFGNIGASFGTLLATTFWLILNAFLSEKLFRTNLNLLSFSTNRVIAITSIVLILFLEKEIIDDLFFFTFCSICMGINFFKSRFINEIKTNNTQ